MQFEIPHMLQQQLSWKWKKSMILKFIFNGYDSQGSSMNSQQRVTFAVWLCLVFLFHLIDKERSCAVCCCIWKLSTNSYFTEYAEYSIENAKTMQNSYYKFIGNDLLLINWCNEVSIISGLCYITHWVWDCNIMIWYDMIWQWDMADLAPHPPPQK